MMFALLAPVQVNDRDSAEMDEMKAAGVNDDDNEGSDSVAPAVEVSTVSVGSMIRMATVDK